jgi:N-acylglucosamine-6-phosphate 2-epimerase
MALAAERGGAAAVRVDSPDHLRAVRALCSVPAIGLYITPTREAALAVVAAGADIVAVDATRRHRPGGETLDAVLDVLRAGPVIMADIATEDEALAALDLGVDMLATTLAGYTVESRRKDGPDFDLVAALSRRAHVPVICEGRLRTASDVRRAFEAGAFAVVVGGAITGVDGLVHAFVRATPQKRIEAGTA